jgi:phospholipid transport system substrate-binding protein
VGEQLVSVVNGPGGIPEKRQQMQKIVDASVDVDGIAQFCLGRFWRNATPDQQRQYVKLFHEVLLNNITGHIGEYQGVRFTLSRTTPRGETQVVDTTVERPNTAPADVKWVVSEASGSPKIVDVEAEGTSLRLTQRSDYASFLQRNGNNVEALISAMRQQVAQSG